MASIKYKDNGEYKDIVVKVGDTLPIGTEVDYEGAEVPNGWEEVSDTNEYSTTEQVVGKWIDGRTLYRKVIVYHPNEIIGSANTTTNISIPHNIANFKQIVKASMVNEGGYVFPTIGSSTGSTITLSDTITKVDTTNINFRIINNAWPAVHFYIILEYTKTTD